ncbi:MAG: chemotaxis protein CheW [Verrucomicrobiota bacterium]
MNAGPPAPAGHSPPSAAAGALRLLDREPPADYLREWTERIAHEKKDARADTRSAFIFRVGEEWLALPPRILQQVAEPCPVRSLPHRRDGVVKGIVNIRGELIVCVSLAAALGLEKEPSAVPGPDRGVYGRLLVVSQGGHRLAFPVDEVHGMHRYHPGDLRPPPATLSGSRLTCTAGLLPWRERTVGCLDDGLLLHTLNRSLA